jgi:hypothetical protein
MTSKKYYSFNDYLDMMNIEDSNIYTCDIQSYINNPKYNFVYNKLFVSQSQNVPCAPLGIYPKTYPVIFKPIYNLHGMSRSFYKIHSDEEYNSCFKDGLFWQEYFPGPQVNLDVVYNKDQIVFYSALQSISGNQGSFKSHETLIDYIIPSKIENWIHTYLKDYKGCLNIEIISGNIIECHLRLNGDFHLYNPEFVGNLYEFFLGNIDTINYIVPYTCMFPLFIHRNLINSLKTNSEKFTKFLMKNPNVITFYYDKLDSIQQSHLLRAMMIEVNDYTHGEKIIELFQKTLNE